jgi:hypothetical protein
MRTLRISLALRHVSRVGQRREHKTGADTSPTAARTPSTSASDRSSSSTITPRDRVGEYAARVAVSYYRVLS